MIRNDAEYKFFSQQLKAQKLKIAVYQKRKNPLKLTRSANQQVLKKLISIHDILMNKVNDHKNFKKGVFRRLENLNDIAFLLIALRIARGLSQKKLAEILGVSAAQVSRDEKNYYSSVSLERAHKTCKALKVKFNIEVKLL